MAFMAAMEARVRIKRNQPTRHRYSAQHVLSCSQYNQGCDGGFPELVGLHVQHFGAVSEKCYPYAAQVRNDLHSHISLFTKIRLE